jgi:hypothetical protein
MMEMMGVKGKEKQIVLFVGTLRYVLAYFACWFGSYRRQEREKGEGVGSLLESGFYCAATAG